MKKLILKLILVLVLLGIASPSRATVAFITSSTGASSDGTANAVSTAANFTGASLLVASCGGGGSPTISSSPANTWVPLTQQSNFVPLYNQLFYVSSPTVSSSQTVTCAEGSSTAPTVIVMAFSGTSTFDVQNGSASGSGTFTQQPGSVTPSTNGQLLITGLTISSNATITIDSGFSTPVYQSDTVNNYPMAMSYIIETTATAKNPTWSSGIANLMITTIATFKASGGAPSIPTSSLLGVF